MLDLLSELQPLNIVIKILELGFRLCLVDGTSVYRSNTKI